MSAIQILAILTALAATQPPAGAIDGIVVNASRENEIVRGAEVALRVEVDGQLMLAAETTTDERGHFRFDNIPADPNYVYLAGASWQTVHYPGERIRLSSRKTEERIQIAVRDAVEAPNPLVVRTHDIVIEPQPGALRVTESLVIDNPGANTYIGKPSGNSSRAATLRLSIPPGFDRTTFHQEFFGRRFALIDDQLVTDIPWTPGTRNLSFTYVLSNSDRRRIWERPLDLPTEKVRIVVHTDRPDEVASNLPRSHSDEAGTITFVSDGPNAAKSLHIELGSLPISPLAHARWIALSLVASLVLGTAYYLRRRPKRSLPERKLPLSSRSV